MSNNYQNPWDAPGLREQPLEMQVEQEFDNLSN